MGMKPMAMSNIQDLDVKFIVNKTQRAGEMIVVWPRRY
jgi:hypothetical protein